MKGQRQRHGEQATVDPMLISLADQVQVFHVRGDNQHRPNLRAKAAVARLIRQDASLVLGAGEGIDLTGLAVANRWCLLCGLGSRLDLASHYRLVRELPHGMAGLHECYEITS